MNRVVLREPQAVRVHPAELHVWRVRVDRSPDALEASLLMLDDAERHRAARFRHAGDRARFVLAHGSLRRLLAMHLGVSNARLAFGANAFGKPLLIASTSGLHFNTSHSGEWILHAFDSYGPVGIDVEAVREELGNLQDFTIALSPEERSTIARLPEPDRPLAFARTWVRKEAYLKAIGEGMSRSPARISVGTDARGQLCLVYDRNETPAPHHWSFHDVTVDEHHVACLVYSSAPGPTAPGRAVVVRDFF